MDYIIFIGFALCGVFSLRGVSIAEKLKNEIGFKKSTLQLHYIIQNQIVSKDPYPLELNTPLAVNLYNQCIMNLRLMFLMIAGLFPVFIFFEV